MFRTKKNLLYEPDLVDFGLRNGGFLTSSLWGAFCSSAIPWIYFPHWAKFGYNPSLIDGILNVLPYELAS